MSKKSMIGVNGKVVLVTVAAATMLLTSAMCTSKVHAEEVYDANPSGNENSVENPAENPTENPFTEELKQYGTEFFRGHYEGTEEVDPNGEYDDPLGMKAQLESLPQTPNQFVSAEDLLDYYRLTNKEASIYDLKPGSVYYMSYYPLHFSAFVKNDYFVSVDKVWEQERGGIFKWFGDFTVRTIQYRDMLTGEVCCKFALTPEVRFYELEKINSVTAPSLKNQFS